MKTEMLTRVAFLVFCGALLDSGIATGQPPLPPPTPPKQVELASIEIIEVTPMAPTPGQAVTITYKITSTVLGNNPLTGNVTGMFQGQKLVELNGGPAPSVTLQPNESKTGMLLISSAGAGDGTLTVNFNRPLAACRGAHREGANGTCLLATASTQLRVVQPTVHVRISGATYTNLSRPDSNDGSYSLSGYQCVVHNPGCGFIFTSGNNGTDKYFNTKTLPLGAKLEGDPYFVEFWPIGIDSSLAAGNLFGTGSYGAKLTSNDPGNIGVKWNNACWGSFGGKVVYYSISFLVSMPKGTDLGEPSFDAASLTTTPCRLDGSVPGGSPAPSGWFGHVLYCNPTTQGETLYLHIRAKLLTPDANAQGDGSPMVEDDLPLQFSQGGSSGSQSDFKTALKYKQGTWQITDAYITLSPTNAAVKHSPLAGLPVSAVLPGLIGSPVFDFRGGSCL